MEKKAKVSKFVYNFEDVQFELDDSDINELDTDMQVYFRFQKCLTSRDYQKREFAKSNTMIGENLKSRMLTGIQNENQIERPVKTDN